MNYEHNTKAPTYFYDYCYYRDCCS